MSFPYLASSGLVAGRPRRKGAGLERTAEVVSDVTVDDLETCRFERTGADGSSPVSDLAKKSGHQPGVHELNAAADTGPAHCPGSGHTSPLALGYNVCA